MAKKKRDWNKFILYFVVIIVTLSTIALYTPMFFGSNNKEKTENNNLSNHPKGTPYAKGPTSTPPQYDNIKNKNKETKETTSSSLKEPEDTPFSSPTKTPEVEKTPDFDL